MIVYLIVLGWCILLAQMTLPPLTFLVGSGPNLLPLLIVYGTLKLRNATIFIVTLVVGWSFDLLSLNKLGISVISASVLASLVLTQARSRAARGSIFQMILVLVGSFLYFTIDYTLYCFQVHGVQFWNWSWPAQMWTKFAFSSILNAVVMMILFPLFNIVPLLRNWEPTHRDLSLHVGR
jgi:cell shape-determining protein MreD